MGIARLTRFTTNAAIACILLAAPVHAQTKPNKLDSVLRQMDAASQKFTSAQADVRKEIFTKIVDNTEEQRGVVYFLRKGAGTQMGLRMTTEPIQIVEYKDGKLRLYSSATNHVDEVAAAGADKGRFETFLTLGFGGSGKDLERAWTITDQGSDKIDGVDTEKLDLVSKDAVARKNFSHVTVWVDPIRGVSLKQVFFFPAGDTQTAYYTNIRLNQPIDFAKFTIKCKGKCS